jgi:hypothetical protein
VDLKTEAMSGAVTLASDVLPYRWKFPFGQRTITSHMEGKAVGGSSNGSQKGVWTTARLGFNASEYTEERQTVGAGFRGLDHVGLSAPGLIFSGLATDVFSEA